MFSLAMSTADRLVRRVVVRARLLPLNPHTTHERHVTQMRDLTCCSYVSLIVDTRNITGGHPPGNAWATSAPIPPADAGSVLNTCGRDQRPPGGPIVLQLRDNPTGFASHIRDRG